MIIGQNSSNPKMEFSLNQVCEHQYIYRYLSADKCPQKDPQKDPS